jgi:transcriptional regulator with XRE-family HTH domain
MTANELYDIRQRLGLSLYDFGRALGYEGNRNTVQVAISRYERGDRDIPPWIARLALMFDRHGIPDAFLNHD